MTFWRNGQVPAVGTATQLQSGAHSDVLLLSMRRIARLVAYCIEYEFEDVIADVTGADRVESDRLDLLELSRRTYKYTRLFTGSRRIARSFASSPSSVRLTRDYELFFPVFNNAYELYALATVENWRARSRRAACFISEVFLQELPTYLLELLNDFDHIFVGENYMVDDIARAVGRPCSYLPLGVDVARFAPYPEQPPRFIDMCSIGRRSAITHAELLRLARNRKFFYHYDTVEASGVDMKQRTFRVQDQREHRLLLASLLQRSRYCFAYRGFANDASAGNGRDEMSARFYEGAAAGAVMIGEPANSPEFREQFDWPDVVVRLPYDSTEIGRVFEELESDPQRVARIRSANVYHAALRHDWLHRLRTVYETFKLPPTPGMLERQRQLEIIANNAVAVREAQCPQSGVKAIRS